MPAGREVDSAPAQRLLGEIGRRVVRLAWIVNAAGALVTFMSVGFLIPIFLDPGERNALGLENAPLILAAVLVGGAVLSRKSADDRRRAFAWIVEDREPSEAEHRLTLRLASRGTARLAAAWAVGGLVISLINLTHSLGFAVVVAATAWLGGETTCALAYASAVTGRRARSKNRFQGAHAARARLSLGRRRPSPGPGWWASERCSEDTGLASPRA